ncbi:STAS domain-containing protein [Lentzea sp. NBC_00516]|uniref:Anti-sigma factor antagonist n=1 Tax=Lentzea sokolovensis TaxID=3095429 RepID=A0ABU4VBZ1_9PSEU|nr:MULTISPECIES: STAS domain-containing protein [unclassified Lentzea]MDX8149219.1 STAS domain-containing protein [Lentzea sp. BCCO 10_0061]WUD25641.1 STAS domain-containing protein [Lentzea sp. NBC_00516]
MAEGTATMELNVGSEVQRGWRVLAVAGELDIDTVPLLSARLDSDVTGVHAVLDLSELAFMDSTGLALVLDWHRRLAEGGGQLRVAAAQGPVRRLFELADVAEVLSLHESVDLAVQEAVDSTR